MPVTREEVQNKINKMIDYSTPGNSFQDFYKFILEPFARVLSPYMEALPESSDSQQGIVPSFGFPEAGLGEDYYAGFGRTDPYGDISGNGNDPDSYNEGSMEKRLPFLGKIPIKGNNQTLQTENASLISRTFGNFVFDTYITGLQQQLNSSQRQATLFGIFDKTDGTNATRDVGVLIDGQDLKIHTGSGFVTLGASALKIITNTATNHSGMCITLSVKEKDGDPTKEVFKLIVNNCLLLNVEAPKRSIARSASMIANPRITFGTNCVAAFARLHSGDVGLFGEDGSWQRKVSSSCWNGLTPLDLTS